MTYKQQTVIVESVQISKDKFSPGKTNKWGKKEKIPIYEVKIQGSDRIWYCVAPEIENYKGELTVQLLELSDNLGLLTRPKQYGR